MYLRLLGTVSLTDDSGADALSDQAQPKRIAVLAYLAVMASSGFVRRDTLLGLFWPDATERDARNALSQALYHIRLLTGADAIVGRGSELIGVDAARLTCDVTEFDEAIKAGQTQSALDLYRGHLMEGFFLSGLPEFDDWLARERAARARRAADAAWMLSDAQPSRRAALDWGARAYSLDPDEGATRRLIALHDRWGDRAGSVHIYEELAARLESEYGAEPAPETQALIATVRARAALVTPMSSSPLFAAAPRPVARPQRRMALVAAAAFVALIVLGGFYATRHRAATPDTAAANDANTVAVFPFSYHGAENSAYLRDGIATLLASRLDGAGMTRTVDPRAILGAVARSKAPVETVGDARAIAQTLGAADVVIGDITESAGRVRISATLAGGGAGQDVRVDAEGDASKAFDVVDELATKLMAGRADATTAGRASSFDTRSAAALRDYLAGDAEYRAGRYSDAVGHLRHALAADSNFALAYYRLATAANWTGDGGLQGWGQDGARAHIRQLAPADSARVAAWMLTQDGSIDSAETLYKRILAATPTDIDARYHLADIHFHYGSSLGIPLASTSDEWQRALALEPTNGGVLLHAARVAAARRDRVRFDSLSAAMNRLELDPDRSLELRVLDAFTFGDSTARAAVMMKDFPRIRASVQADVFAVTAAVSPTLEDVDNRIINSWLKGHAVLSRADGTMLIRAQIELARGHRRAMYATLDTTALLNPVHAREFRAFFATLPFPSVPAQQRRAIAAELEAQTQFPTPRAVVMRHYLLGMLAVRDGDSTTARAHAAMLDTVHAARRDDSAYAVRCATTIRAEVLRSAGRSADALALLGPPAEPPEHGLPAIWSYPFAHERFLRAQLLEDVGRNEEALRWYETFPDPRAYDFMFRVPALQRRAVVAAKLGRTRDADAAKRELAGLLRTADPGVVP